MHEPHARRLESHELEIYFLSPPLPPLTSNYLPVERFESTQGEAAAAVTSGDAYGDGGGAKTSS